MILAYVWTGAVILALAVGLFTGSAGSLAAAAVEGAQAGITATVSIAGALCLWTGLSEVMEKSGVSRLLSRLLRPLLGCLFPKTAEDENAMGSLCGNFTANLLGLGNAATPLGIRAVQQMRARSGSEDATDEMCRLIVLNTASIQLIPSTVAAVRASLGAASPFDILPAVWLTSLLSAAAGLLAARLFAGRRHG